MAQRGAKMPRQSPKLVTSSSSKLARVRSPLGADYSFLRVWRLPARRTISANAPSRAEFFFFAANLTRNAYTFCKLAYHLRKDTGPRPEGSADEVSQDGSRVRRA